MKILSNFTFFTEHKGLVIIFVSYELTHCLNTCGSSSCAVRSAVLMFQIDDREGYEQQVTTRQMFKETLNLKLDLFTRKLFSPAASLLKWGFRIQPRKLRFPFSSLRLPATHNATLCVEARVLPSTHHFQMMILSVNSSTHSSEVFSARSRMRDEPLSWCRGRENCWNKLDAAGSLHDSSGWTRVCGMV